MDAPDPHTHGTDGTPGEDWLRTQLSMHAGDVLVRPPDLASIDSRRRGIRRRRASMAVCAVSAVTAGAVVAAVALMGSGGDEAHLANPPATIATSPPAETGPAQPPTTGPAATTAPGNPSPSGTHQGGTATLPALPPATPGPGTGTGTATRPATGAPNTGAPNNSGGGTGGTNGTRSCASSDVSVVLSGDAQRSVRHLLMTATNTSASACTLHFYPDVVFHGVVHDSIGPMESPAAAIATLAPGQKAYSGIFLYRANESLEASRSMAVNLRDAVNDGYTGNPIDLSLPEGWQAVKFGPSATSTFWNTDLAAVNRYLYAR
ncbi:DUF4232 domain-containing protein [Yinghuangia soli]|uniref:DUF4232 domain-containing protein n=1 Tax=Yinghuangia soli TaxID=2908204 RepID=A0AA41U6A8_9ACTN|nr:DUF4232 domain-containing protein [Yinghuangia soli]MCF2530804.1 DUF4232 domain-containing protein [Yinghuangia soli]